MLPPKSMEIPGRVAPIAAGLNSRLFMAVSGHSFAEQFKRPTEPQALWLRSSQDDGFIWSSPQLLLETQPQPGVVFWPFIFGTGKGVLQLFYLRYHRFDAQAVEESRCELWHARSINNALSWSKPRLLNFGQAYTGSLNCVLGLRSGRILVPLSYLSRRKQGRFVSTVLFTDDQGASWKRSQDDVLVLQGTLEESGALEPVVVELGDGRVWMLIRTTTGLLYQSFSRNGGLNWSQAEPTDFVSSNSPAGLLRLKDGRLLVFWNGCRGEPSRQGVSYARQTLHVAISADDSRSWSAPMPLVSKADKDPDQSQYTYPIPYLTPAGQIMLLYQRVATHAGEDWHNPTGRVLRLDPDWVVAMIRHQMSGAGERASQ